MPAWLNLTPRGDLTPLDWDAYGVPPNEFHYVLLQGGDDTGIICQQVDRSQIDGIGCAARPANMSALSSIRIHGRFALVSLQGVSTTVYAKIIRSDTLAVVGELSVVPAQSFVPVAFDMGTLSGISIPGNEVNFLKVELSCQAASNPGISIIISQLLFDYTEDVTLGRSVLFKAESGKCELVGHTGNISFDAESGDCELTPA
jgi:hypothetical protein